MELEFVMNNSEMSLRKGNDGELRRVNRALATVSKCNKALVRATNEDDLLQEICQILVDSGGYRMAWVTFRVEDPDALLPTVAKAGVDNGYLDGIHLTWRQVDKCDGPIGKAIQTLRPAKVDDLQTDPYFAPWIKEATKRGYASCLALPLLQETCVLGVIVIHASEINAFDSTEVELLTELAGNVAFGIMALRTRNELRRSEQRYRLLFDHNLAAVFHASDGKLLDCNEAMCEMLGYSRQELYALDLHMLYPNPSDRDTGQRQLYERGHLTNYQIDLTRKDGSVLTVLANLNVMREDSRSAPVVVGVMLDITTVRKLQEQLLQSQKMEAVGQMAGAVAHDFNNLLMGISSQTELLMTANDPHKAEERARTILSAIESAGGLTKKLLAFSRKQELATSNFDLNQLVAETNEFVLRLLPKNISVDARLSPSPCWVNVDRVQMEQTLINIVLNARDAMPEGGTLVLNVSHIDVDANDVGLHGGVPAGAYALIGVADTGHGIAEQHLGKIFEPFFTTKPKERGTGLGLSIAYGIISQSGGYIRVKSTVGAGTTFTVYIPSVERAQVEPPILNPCPLEISDTSCPLQGTILVVDDEALVRTSIRAYLELNGLSVCDCGDAPEALTVASELKDKLALLITDVMMPKMTGVELARALVVRMPDLPIIFMSGYAAGESGHEEFRQAKFLQKPFSCATLLDTVCEGLRICPRQGNIQNT